jgi:hypothetical protein
MGGKRTLQILRSRSVARLWAGSLARLRMTLDKVLLGMQPVPSRKPSPDDPITR